jgi:hypothetical protein
VEMDLERSPRPAINMLRENLNSEKSLGKGQDILLEPHLVERSSTTKLVRKSAA